MTARRDSNSQSPSLHEDEHGAQRRTWLLRLREEVGPLDLRVLIARALGSLIPMFSGNRVRTALLRFAGARIGAGSLFFGMPVIMPGPGGAASLAIGSNCVFNIGCVFEAGGGIAIGNGVSVGQQVMIITTTHAMTEGTGRRRAAMIERSRVEIRDGAWIGARALILPGVTVGAGAVVAAGSVVNRSVPADVMVAGTPAKVLKALPDGWRRGPGGEAIAGCSPDDDMTDLDP